jgi:hypothetical protein
MVHSTKQAALETPIANNFGRCRLLKERGITFLVDASGCLFTSLVADLRDVKVNREANLISHWSFCKWYLMCFFFCYLEAVCAVCSCLTRKQRLAPTVLAKAVLAYLSSEKMFPVGITKDLCLKYVCKIRFKCEEIHVCSGV